MPRVSLPYVPASRRYEAQYAVNQSGSRPGSMISSR